MNPMPKIIKIKKPNGEIINCHSIDYIKAKMQSLIDFGYTNLTLEEISLQLKKIYNNEELNVIGLFMIDDIILD